MGYLFSGKYTISQEQFYEKKLGYAVKHDWSAKAFNDEMSKFGMGRRKKEYLHDYRRGLATQKSKEWKARGRAATWFDKIFEPKRVAKGWKGHDFTDFKQRGKYGMWKDTDEFDEWMEYSTQTEEAFPELYEIEKETIEEQEERLEKEWKKYVKYFTGN